MNIDYKLLKRQRNELVNLMADDQAQEYWKKSQKNAVDGAINLMDALLDEYEESKTKNKYVVEIPLDQKGTLVRDNLLATNHIKDKILICVYSKGQAIKKARLFEGKAKMFKDKPNKNKYFIQ